MKLRFPPLLLFLCACLPLPAAVPANLPDGLYALISTPRGTVTCELFFAKAPLTVANFVGLAEGKLGPVPRRPFFDGLTFHRVVPGFVVQGGDPLGTGEGGPGYKFPDEFVPGLRHDAAGILSMANDGPDTNGSQFFITLAPVNRLNYLHSVFGRVVAGLDVLPQVRVGDKMTVKIRRVGAAAAAFAADEKTFAALAAKTRKFAEFAAAKRDPGADAHFDDPAKILPLTPPRARNFNFKLANFERATGLRLVARLRAKSPTDAEDAQPGAFMRGLAGPLGTLQRGALAVYFADDNSWRIWVGDESTPAFVGRPGTAAGFTESGLMHEVKEAFLKSARETAETEFAAQQQAARPDAPLPPAQKLKLEADALLDGLIFKLETALGTAHP